MVMVIVLANHEYLQGSARQRKAMHGNARQRKATQGSGGVRTVLAPEQVRRPTTRKAVATELVRRPDTQKTVVSDEASFRVPPSMVMTCS